MAQFEKSFQKKISTKAILVSKYEKTESPKMTSKIRLKALNKELSAIFVFFTNLKFDDFQKIVRKPGKI